MTTHDYGSVEGILNAEFRRDQQATFNVWNEFDGKVIVCWPFAMLDWGRENLGRRVSVTGKVQYRGRGRHKRRPDVMMPDPDGIRLMPDVSIRFEDIGPINITDGVPSEDHVAMMRGED